MSHRRQHDLVLAARDAGIDGIMGVLGGRVSQG